MRSQQRDWDLPLSFPSLDSRPSFRIHDSCSHAARANVNSDEAGMIHVQIGESKKRRKKKKKEKEKEKEKEKGEREGERERREREISWRARERPERDQRNH